MEKILRPVALKVFAASHWRIAAFITLAVLLLLCLRLQAESYHFGVYTDDEYHTVHEGLNLLVDGRVDNFRAQEGTRWLVRAFYPMALIYMNTHMGGNVFINGWTYPGHDYVVRQFVHQKDDPGLFSLDPNLRDLFHALRMQYIGFVCICVLALFGLLYMHRYYLAAFGGILALGLSLDIQREQQIFYIEPSMLAALAVCIALYTYFVFKWQVQNYAAPLFGFLFAFLVSTKFSMAPFALLPLFLFAYVLPRKKALLQGLVYLITFPISYLLVNYPAFISLGSFNTFLHDLTSNFWQYAAGSDSSITVAPGLAHLGRMVYQLEGFMGYSLYALPFLVFFGIYLATKKERMLIVPLLLLSLASFTSLASQHVYLPRNVLPLYLSVLVIFLISMEAVSRFIYNHFGRKPQVGFVGLLAALWLVGIVMHAGGLTLFSNTLLPNAKSGFIAQLEAVRTQATQHPWYAVDFEKGFFTGTSFEQDLKSKAGVPNVLNEKNYSELEARFASLPEGSVVLVHNIKNNKHLTHYVLPKEFAQNMQFGEYYVFTSKR